MPLSDQDKELRKLAWVIVIYVIALLAAVVVPFWANK